LAYLADRARTRSWAGTASSDARQWARYFFERMNSASSPITDSDAPRFALAWAMLACALATLTLAYPALTGGFLVSLHSDQYIAGYAFREFAAASLKAGEGFPQWNPFLFGGMPYLDAMHGDIFYPTFLLR